MKDVEKFPDLKRLIARWYGRKAKKSLSRGKKLERQVKGGDEQGEEMVAVGTSFRTSRSHFERSTSWNQRGKENVRLIEFQLE